MRLVKKGFVMGKADVIVRRKIDQRLGFGQLAQSVVILALLEFGLKGFWQFHDYKYKERRVVFSPDGNGILLILFAKQNYLNLFLLFLSINSPSHKNRQRYFIRHLL